LLGEYPLEVQGQLWERSLWNTKKKIE
jgi:hypothetical protein